VIYYDILCYIYGFIRFDEETLSAESGESDDDVSSGNDLSEPTLQQLPQ
jgi:hypothetical protein